MEKTINQNAIEALRKLIEHQPGLFAGHKVNESGGENVAEFYFGFLRKFTEMKKEANHAARPSPPSVVANRSG